jgi:multidrug efflux system membrane fusion protein
VVDNSDGLLTPGLFARVQLATGSRDGAASTLVLERAIGTDQNRKFVYVVGARNMAEYRPIQLGTPMGELRVVNAGLKVGDQVVVDGLQRVRPGAPLAPAVVPMDPAEAASAAAAAAAASAPAAK